MAYGNVDSPSLLFGNQQLALLYWIFCYSFNHVLLYIGIFLYFNNKNKLFLLLGWLPILFDSLIFMGRGAFIELIHIMFFIFLVKIFIFNNKIIQIIQRNKKLFLVSLFFPIIMAFGSQLRGDVENINLTAFTLQFCVEHDKLNVLFGKYSGTPPNGHR